MNKFLLYLIPCLLLIHNSVPAQLFIDYNDDWAYLKGTTEPPATWMSIGFNDSGWKKGKTPFRYGDGTVGTELTDMFENYTTLYLRKNFTIDSMEAFDQFVVTVDYDDGFVIWINGNIVLIENAPRTYEFDQLARHPHESGTPATYILDPEEIGLVTGPDSIAVQGFNVIPHSTDFFLNIKVEGYAKLPETDGTVTTNYLSGFYQSPFNETISTVNPEDQIKYTLDGSNPPISATAITANSPAIVPINPDGTAGNRGKTGGVVLRASIFKEGFIPGKPITRNYIFLNSVVAVENHPGGSWRESSVNGQVIDLPMDQNVVNDSRYANDMEAALLDIPTILVSTDQENFFDSAKGIYVNAKYHGKEWERPANIELINPDGSPGFNEDAGIRMRGGWSRHSNFAKHAFRIFFRSEYGEGKLDFPLFGDEGVDEFDKIDLRTSQNYSWSKGGGQSKYNTMNRDVFSRHTQRDMHQPYTRSRYYHLYLNGLYWGVYQSQERAEANFAESYFGGDKEDYDVIKVDIGENWNLYEIEATDGNTAIWQEIWNMCVFGFTSNHNYFQLLGKSVTGAEDTTKAVYIDIDNFVDYMLTIFYTGNFDAPVSKFSGNHNPNNFFAIKNRTKKREGFKFLTHDSEHSLLADPVSPGVGLVENRVELDLNVRNFGKFHPQWLHHKLTANQEYRIKVADRIYRHFFNTGVFTEDSSINRFMETANQLDMAIIGESARWGDRGNNPARNKHDDWLPAVNQVVEDYMPYRTQIVIEQLKNAGLYPTTAPPVFTENGATIIENKHILSGSFTFSMENPNSSGTIFYTTNGTDPRLVGGAASNLASSGGNSKTLTVMPGNHVMARVKNGSEWSALHEIVFEDSGLFSNLKVTELHYHPTDQGEVGGKQLEFLELKNIGGNPLDLSGLTFSDGINFTFPEGTTIAAGGFIVLASNQMEFNNLYGFKADFEYTGSLSNGGERVVLETPTNDVVIEFTFLDEEPWPVEADGDGYSLVATEANPAGDPNLPTYWTISKQLNGSPFSNDPNSISTSAPLIAENNFDLLVYPNPATSSVTIDFRLENNEDVEIGLFDINGKFLHYLCNEPLWSGDYSRQIQLNHLNIKPGMYLVVFKSASNIKTKKLMYSPGL